MTRQRAVAVLALAVALTAAAAGAARAHSASRGLHLHLSPDKAARGADVAVAVNAAEPIVALAIGFVGQEPVRIAVKPAARDAAVTLKVPVGAAGESINVQAEATAESGKTLRAAAILQLLPRGDPPREGGR
ncbi:MAG: hypothetical protein MUF27_15920 [Acidobacteria bacterium]|jgi:hypothetical protein|nr:hypothetical protein [Acidobacteriota bacterium]